MADESWTAKFPHPGAAPPTPSDEKMFDPAVLTYNKWVEAVRKHNIARSVDTLIAVEQSNVPLNAVETITLTLGLMILDGSIKAHRHYGIFGAF